MYNATGTCDWGFKSSPPYHDQESALHPSSLIQDCALRYVDGGLPHLFCCTPSLNQAPIYVPVPKWRELIFSAPCRQIRPQPIPSTKKRRDMQSCLLGVVPTYNSLPLPKSNENSQYQLTHYVEVRWQMNANFIVSWPIFDYCEGR